MDLVRSVPDSGGDTQFACWTEQMPIGRATTAYTRLHRHAGTRSPNQQEGPRLYVQADPDGRAETAEHEWTRWIERYWSNRVSSVPTTLTEHEASAIAQWAPYLLESFPAAVDLTTTVPCGLPRSSNLLNDLAERNVADVHPNKAAQFLAHLLHGTAGRIWDCRPITKMFEQLSSRLGETELGPIREHATRLGCMADRGLCSFPLRAVARLRGRVRTRRSRALEAASCFPARCAQRLRCCPTYNAGSRTCVRADLCGLRGA